MDELLTLEQLCSFMVGSIPVGMLLGGFPMVVGLAVHVIVNIFRKV